MGDVVRRRATGGRRHGLCTAYIYTGEEDGGSRGGGGVTRSREHYSDARGGTRQSTLNRGARGGQGGLKKVWVVRVSTCESSV